MNTAPGLREANPADLYALPELGAHVCNLYCQPEADTHATTDVVWAPLPLEPGFSRDWLSLPAYARDFGRRYHVEVTHLEWAAEAPPPRPAERVPDFVYVGTLLVVYGKPQP
jgi:hypothetical protein